MSSENEDIVKKTCRLCAEDHEATVTLFSQQSYDMLLNEKLSKYLLIELDEKDKLPKNICVQCCTKLHTLCAFVDDVRQAQLLLYKKHFSDNNLKYEDKQLTTVHEADDINHVSRDDVDSTDSEASLKIDETEPLLCQKPKNNLSYRKSFNCQTCKRSFVTDIALRSHIWTHNVNAMKFNEKSTIKKIEMTEPAVNGIWNCQLCSRRFRSQLTYAKHMAMHLSVRGNVHTCKQCGKAYRNWGSLKVHNLTHSNVKPHSCPICPKKFRRKLEVQVHLNQHTGKRPYKCPHCERTFASSSNCTSHRKRLHPGKVVTQAKAVKVQDKKETIEVQVEVKEGQSDLVKDRGVVRYQCQQCSHSFSSRENYMCHMFQHTGKKMFQCSLCDAEFITERGLTIHCYKLHPFKRNKPSEIFFMSKNMLKT